MGEQVRPRNPYRHDELADGLDVMGAVMDTRGGPNGVPRHHGGRSGPGLLASDIDRLARQHYMDGHAAAERKYEQQLDEMRGRLADAFDEGAAAQDGLNTVLVWNAVRRRVVADLHFALMGVENGPKSKREAGLTQLRVAIDELLNDVDLMESAGPAAGEPGALADFITRGRVA